MATILRLAYDQNIPEASNWHLQSSITDNTCRRQSVLLSVDSGSASPPIDRNYLVDHVIRASHVEGRSNPCFDEAVAAYLAGKHCHVALLASASRWEGDDTAVDPLFETIEADLLEACRKLVSLSGGKLFVDILVDDTQGHVVSDFPKTQSATAAAAEGPQQVTSFSSLATLIGIVVRRRSQLRGARAVSMIVLSNSSDSLLLQPNGNRPSLESHSYILFVLPSAYPLVPSSSSAAPLSCSPSQSYVSLSYDLFSRAFFSQGNNVDEEGALYESLIDGGTAWCSFIKRLAPRRDRAGLSVAVYAADGAITGKTPRFCAEVTDLFFLSSNAKERLPVTATSSNLSAAASAHIEAQAQLLEASAQRIAKLETLLKLKGLPDASLTKMLMDSALEIEVLRKRCALLENRLHTVKSSKFLKSSSPSALAVTQQPAQLHLELLQRNEWDDSTSSKSSSSRTESASDSDSDSSSTSSADTSSSDDGGQRATSDEVMPSGDGQEVGVLSSLRLSDVDALMPRNNIPRTFSWRDDATRHQQLQRLLAKLQDKHLLDSDLVIDWANIPSILRTFLHSLVRTQEQCRLLAAFLCPHHLVTSNVQDCDFEELILVASRFPWVNTPELVLRSLLPDAIQNLSFQRGTEPPPRVLGLKISEPKVLRPGIVLVASVRVTDNVDFAVSANCRWPARLRWYRVAAGGEADPSNFRVVKEEEEAADGNCQYFVTNDDVGHVLWFEVLPRHRFSGLCGAAASVRSHGAVQSNIPQVSNVRIVQCSAPETLCQWVCVGDYVRVEYNLLNVGLEGLTHIRWFVQGAAGWTWLAEGRAPSCTLQVPCSASYSYLCAGVLPVRARDNRRGTSHVTLAIFVVPRLDVSVWLDGLLCRVPTLKPSTSLERITTAGYEWRASSSIPNDVSSLSGVFLQPSPEQCGTFHGISEQLFDAVNMTSCTPQISPTSQSSNIERGTWLKTSIGSPTWKEETALATVSSILTLWLPKGMTAGNDAFLRVERHGIELGWGSAPAVCILWCNIVWIRELVVAVRERPAGGGVGTERTADYFPIMIKYRAAAQDIANVSCIFRGRDAFERCLMALKCFLQLSQINKELSPSSVEECRLWGATWLDAAANDSTQRISPNLVGTAAHRHFNFLQEEL